MLIYYNLKRNGQEMFDINNLYLHKRMQYPFDNYLDNDNSEFAISCDELSSDESIAFHKFTIINLILALYGLPNFFILHLRIEYFF